MSSHKIAQRIKDRRMEIGMSAEHLGELIGKAKTTIYRYESGYIEKMPTSILESIANALGVSAAYLMGWEDDEQKLPNFPNIPPVARRKIPMLGETACGKPIYINEEKELYTLFGADIAVDFCLTARGDSMIDARIHDGDIVFVRKQSEVENGEIAAVRIGEEATLKRVYYYPEKGQLVLQAANPNYEPLVYIGDELTEIEILGKAIVFQSDVK